MGFRRAATITAGLALGALLVAPAAFAGRGWNGGCYGPRWSGQDAPRAEERYRGGRGGYRGDCGGPGDCFGDDRRGRFERRGGEGYRGDCPGPADCFGARDGSRGGRWDCRGPRDCDGPGSCWDRQATAPEPEREAPAPDAP